jgi:lysophospholipid acyltransferase (LPLAT)-like uncharacterized protein
VKAVFRHPGVQAFLGLVLAGYLILVRRTVRWRHENGDCMDRLAEGEGAIGLFWHGRILLCLGATEAWWKLRRRCMVSPSHDGEFIARALEYARWPAIRISSAKPGDTEKARAAVAALREAIDWVRDGGGLIITPDGPRGPNEVIAPGAVQIARRSGGAVFLMGFAVSPALRLKTWDKAMIPAPFGRGAVVWVGPLYAPADIGLAETEALIADWSAKLSAATRRAEALVSAAPDIDPTVPQ